MSKKAGNAVVNYFRDSFEEFRKVTWPTKEHALKIILIVMVFTVGMGIFTGAFDALFSFGYQQLLNLSQSIKF